MMYARRKARAELAEPVIPSKRVVGYIRVSSATQEQGDSLSEQERRIREYCQRNGLELVEPIYKDAETGGSLKERTGFLDALRVLRSSDCSALVMLNVSRYFREVGQGELIRKSLQKAGKTLRSVEQDFDFDTETGEAGFQMQLVFAEWERKTIKKRLYGMRMAKVERGSWIGHRVPFGWRPAWNHELNINQLVPVPEEQMVMRCIRRLYMWAGFTQSEIARYLNKQMEQDPLKWGPKSSKEIKRPRYKPYVRQPSGKWSQKAVRCLLFRTREIDECHAS